jgi:hypothetical protein
MRFVRLFLPPICKENSVYDIFCTSVCPHNSLEIKGLWDKNLCLFVCVSLLMFVFFAVRVVSKESKGLVFPRFLCV